MMKEQHLRHKSLNYNRKNRRKAVRTLLQFIILIFVGFLLVRAFFDLKSYEAGDKSTWTNHDGFIAISYFGVGRSGTEDLVARRKLDEQLKLLKEHGYVTISQQDVLDFYEKNKPLPDKALFLAFEDGRNDSALFAQPILENYNFKATMLTYANKMGSREGKFLQPKDLLKMQQKGFWELGTNGYRLTYINIVDKDGKFIGNKDHNTVETLKQAQYYTHYLMDFLRDDLGLPIENKHEMEARIAEDYRLMEETYKKTLGFVPTTYMIMHANALGSGMNKLVADVNEQNIERLFQLHFNREGNLLNRAGDNTFDLTRVQPAPYWQINHLLMKLRKDTGDAVHFVQGDPKKAELWSEQSGAAEYEGNQIALTSLPGDKGKIQLKDSESFGNIHLQTTLAGHASGQQSVYLREDKQDNAYIRILVRNNEIIVEQKKAGEQVERLLQYPFERDVLDEQQLKVSLQERALSVSLNNVELLHNEPIRVIGNGGISLEAEANPLSKDDIYDGVFRDLSISKLSDTGELEEALFSNKYRGLELIKVKLVDSYHKVIDWAIETF